jgi:hypothetical protein
MTVYLCFQCRDFGSNEPQREVVKVVATEKDARAWCDYAPVTDFRWREYEEFKVEEFKVPGVN